MTKKSLLSLLRTMTIRSSSFKVKKSDTISYRTHRVTPTGIRSVIPFLCAFAVKNVSDLSDATVPYVPVPVPVDAGL